jgi:hypothetical protein
MHRKEGAHLEEQQRNSQFVAAILQLLWTGVNLINTWLKVSGDRLKLTFLNNREG